MSLKSGSAFGGPPAPVSPPLFEMRRSGLTPSQSQGTSRGYFRLFLLFSFLLFEYWSSIRSGDPRMAPLKRLRSHPPMLDPYMSTNCSASRGFAFARAPLPRADGSPRVLIWMLDDRVLSSTFPPPTDYVSVAVMHNYQYAKSKGYDFVLFRPLRKSKRLDSAGAVIDETNLLAKAFNKDEKRGINQLGCFNSKVGRWRASTWCKVLAQWALTSEDPLDATLARWDFMVFLDSDAVVADPALDVEDAFINSRNGSGHIGGKSTYGLTSGGGGAEAVFGTPAGPTLFLLSDRQIQYNENAWNLANLGFFVARDTPQLRPLVKTWWEAEPGDDSERFDVEPFHEQEIFWRMQEWPLYSNAMRRSVRVWDAPWAPLVENAKGNFQNTGGWLQHVNSEEDGASFGQARNNFFTRILDEMAANPTWRINGTTWEPAVKEFLAGCHMMPIDFDSLDLGIRGYRKGIEDLSIVELWSPLPPPAASFPSPLPLPYKLTKKWNRNHLEDVPE